MQGLKFRAQEVRGPIAVDGQHPKNAVPHKSQKFGESCGHAGFFTGHNVSKGRVYEVLEEEARNSGEH